MAENWEHPACWYRLIDELINYRLGGLIYGGYLKSLGLKGSESVLDFGSGSGAGSRQLAKRLQNGGCLTCVDTSVYWTGVAQKRMKQYDNVEFYTKPLTELNFRQESFDIVYMYYAFHDVNPQLRGGIIQECYRILKSDGKLLIKEPQRIHDGIPVAEIRKHMISNEFLEVCSQEIRETFQAVYKKRIK